MTKGNISIEISGGTASFGNISQGDNAKLIAEQATTVESDELANFYQAVEALMQHQGVSAVEYEALRQDVAKMLDAPAESADAVQRAKTLYERYAWAAAPLKVLLDAVWA